MSATAIARCVGCGCTDTHACELGCYWLAVNRHAGLGVCSECPGQLAGFKLAQRRRFTRKEISQRAHAAIVKRRGAS